jgi:hypothetical protein
MEYIPGTPVQTSGSQQCPHFQALKIRQKFRDYSREDKVQNTFAPLRKYSKITAAENRGLDRLLRT